jgi:hypothetical protein
MANTTRYWTERPLTRYDTRLLQVPLRQLHLQVDMDDDANFGGSLSSARAVYVVKMSMTDDQLTNPPSDARMTAWTARTFLDILLGR